jgi:hypothetical protein
MEIPQISWKLKIALSSEFLCSISKNRYGQSIPPRQEAFNLLTAVLMEKIMAGIEINKAAGGILIESLWLQLRQRRKHQVFQIYAVND